MISEDRGTDHILVTLMSTNMMAVRSSEPRTSLFIPLQGS